MRIYAARYYPADGSLRRCIHADPKRMQKGCRRHQNFQPYQTVTILVYHSPEDKVNLMAFSTISCYVFCTPRCYISKSWEVGICNTYQVRLLVGSDNLSSRDFQMLMLFERIQVILQYLEIKEQTTGYFYLPDKLAVGYPRKRSLFTPYPQCRSLIQFYEQIHNHLYGGTDIPITGMLASLNLIRRKYFSELHYQLPHLRPLKQFRRIFGQLYGRIQYRCVVIGLDIRQYFAHQPIINTVNYLSTCNCNLTTVFRMESPIVEINNYVFIPHYLKKPL